MAKGPSDQEDEATWPSLTCMESFGTAHRGQGSTPAGPRLCPPRSPATACGSAVRHQLRPNRPGPVPQERRTLGTHAPAVVAAHPQVGQDVLSTPPPRPRVPTPPSAPEPEPAMRAAHPHSHRCTRSGLSSNMGWSLPAHPNALQKKNGMETFFSRYLFSHSKFASLLFTIKQCRIYVCIVLRNS